MPRGRKYKQYGRRKIDAGITNFAFSSVRTSLSGVLSTSLGLMDRPDVCRGPDAACTAKTKQLIFIWAGTSVKSLSGIELF